MFEKQYKNTFDNIKPSNESVNHALEIALNNEGSKSILTVKRLVACGIAVAILIASVFAVMNFTQEAKQLDGIRPARDYDDVYEFISASKHQLYQHLTNSSMIGGQDSIPETTAKDDIIFKNDVNDNINTNDFSDTNNQVVGVQEADIVKTDGEYIYCLNLARKTLFVAQANEGDIAVVASVKIIADNIYDMLLVGNYVSVICSNVNKTVETVALYYDVSDKSKPTYRYSLTQEGNYVSCRAVDDTIIVITNKYVYTEIENNEMFLPKINGKEISATSIWLPETICSSAFTVITSHSIGNVGEFDSAISVYGASNTVYASKENIYLSSLSTKIASNESPERCNSTTDIYRITLSDSKLSVAACGTVDGNVSNQFNFDEANGFLRVATNVSYYKKAQNGLGKYLYESITMDNKVFCLDENLEVIGESEPVGINEEIKSVRYIGDVAYVVTFKRTDPLYAIDLSNPKKPKVLSELKITGFSSYMQQYTENYMLGIGFEANSSNGASTGLKLTMFDISNSAEIKDVSSIKYLWNTGYSSSEATYNHKAILINGRKGIIAVPMYTTKAQIANGNQAFYKEEISYTFFEFDGKSLKEKKNIVISDILNMGEIKDTFIRGIFINDYVYVVCCDGIASVSLTNYSVSNTLLFE